MPVKKLRVFDVFVPGGMPSHTYISRAERGLENRLSKVKENLCKLVTVTGATKSGKTVLTRKILPVEEALWIDGGTVVHEDDLWSAILEHLGGYTELNIDQSYSTTLSVSAEAGGEAGIPLIGKVGGKTGGGFERGGSRARSTKLAISARAAAAKALRSQCVPLVIDDFHYIKDSTKGSIVRVLKQLIFDGLPVVLIAIPHRRYDAVKVEKEMTGRLESIVIPAWGLDELKDIANIGFPLLNMNVKQSIVDRLAKESFGSPHLMQEFCRTVATKDELVETANNPIEIGSIQNQVFESVAEGTGKVVFDRLAKGPRQRSDRKQRRLKNGGTADIYRVVLLALSSLKPGLDSIGWEQLRSSIKNILSDDIPQAHEVSRVLERMTEIAATDGASTPVIDWEKDQQRLHVTDPFFAFYLKWGVDR